MRFIFFLFVLGTLVGCSGGSGVGTNGGVPANSQPGWTADLIETLIACKPYPGPICDCVVPQITRKYSPDQVREKSPFVSADMLGMKADCTAAGSAVAIEKPEPSSPLSYPSLPGQGCTTGEHSFSTLEEMCQGLQSDSLNHYCAEDYRRRLFEKMCPGGFQPRP